MNPILLDTHVAIWAAGDQLQPEIARLVTAAAARHDLLLSAITAWEIGMLTSRRRLALALPVEEYVRVLFSQPGVVVAAVTPSIAVAAATLPGTPIADPADRILIASAAFYGAQIVTRDRKIREYAKSSGQIRCIAC